MKIFKLVVLSIFLYIGFICLMFLSLESPTFKLEGISDVNVPVPLNEAEAVKLNLNNLNPDFTYNIEIFINKTSKNNLFIINKQRKLLFKIDGNLASVNPVKLLSIKNIQNIDLFIYEEPAKLSKKDINYYIKKDEIKLAHYQKLIEDIKDNNKHEFAKDLEIINNNLLLPGEESLGYIPAPIDTTYIKKLVAKPIKNKDTLLTINRTIILSYKKYIIQDIPFKVIYVILLLVTLWLIFKTKPRKS